jgi:voltage-gated potassium channel
MTARDHRKYYNVWLLISIILFITASLLSGDQIEENILVSACSSAMLLAATYTIQNKRKRLIYFAIGVILLREGTEYLSLNQYIFSLASLANVGFFLYIVFHLVRQVARSKEVNADVILESINGYLLVGLSGSVLLSLVYRIQESSFAFAAEGTRQLSEFIYYGFITLTTIGYGEITPVTGMARLLAIFTGISGQLYIAIIIATLVGKYLAQQNKPE